MSQKAAKLYRRMARIGIRPDVAASAAKYDASVSHAQKNRFRRQVSTAIANRTNTAHPVHVEAAHTLHAVHAHFGRRSK